jgi:hypothetical protein
MCTSFNFSMLFSIDQSQYSIPLINSSSGTRVKECSLSSFPLGLKPNWPYQYETPETAQNLQKCSLASQVLAFLS